MRLLGRSQEAPTFTRFAWTGHQPQKLGHVRVPKTWKRILPGARPTEYNYPADPEAGKELRPVDENPYQSPLSAPSPQVWQQPAKGASLWWLVGAVLLGGTTVAVVIGLQFSPTDLRVYEGAFGIGGLAGLLAYMWIRAFLWLGRRPAQP